MSSPQGTGLDNETPSNPEPCDPRYDPQPDAVARSARWCPMTGPSWPPNATAAVVGIVLPWPTRDHGPDETASWRRWVVMQGAVGDTVVIHSRRVDQAERTGTISEVRGADGRGR